MQIFEGSRNLGSIEARVIFWDTLSWASLQSAEELATTAILHAEIEMVFRLERVVQRNNERMVTRGKDFLLCEGSLDLVSLNHFFFAQNYIGN